MSIEYRHIEIIKALQQSKSKEFKLLTGRDPSQTELKSYIEVGQQSNRMYLLLGNHSMKPESRKEQNNRFNNTKLSY